MPTQATPPCGTTTGGATVASASPKRCCKSGREPMARTTPIPCGPSTDTSVGDGTTPPGPGQSGMSSKHADVSVGHGQTSRVARHRAASRLGICLSMTMSSHADETLRESEKEECQRVGMCGGPTWAHCGETEEGPVLPRCWRMGCGYCIGVCRRLTTGWVANL